MIRSVTRAIALVLPLALVASACSSPTQPTTTATTATTTTTTATTSTVPATETFNGALVQGATGLHAFHSVPGTVTVTLVSFDPSTNYPPVGFGLGMWDGITCKLVLETTEAAPATVLVGTASVEMDLCVKLWDPDTMASDYTLKYQVTAVHQVKSSS